MLADAMALSSCFRRAAVSVGFVFVPPPPPPVEVDEFDPSTGVLLDAKFPGAHWIKKAKVEAKIRRENNFLFINHPFDSHSQSPSDQRAGDFSKDAKTNEVF